MPRIKCKPELVCSILNLATALNVRLLCATSKYDVTIIKLIGSQRGTRYQHFDLYSFNFNWLLPTGRGSILGATRYRFDDWCGTRTSNGPSPQNEYK